MNCSQAFVCVCLERIMSSRKFGRIPAAKAHSGLGRSSLYKLAEKHRGLFRKFGAAVIVDLEFLDQILAALPPADIGAKAAAALIREDKTAS
jgi:hypothetical protein